MNIQRYLLPVTVAAAFHAALLWALPPGTIPALGKNRTTDSFPKPPEIPVDIAEPVPAEETELVDVVKPLAGGPQRPEIPDNLTEIGIKDFVVPIERTNPNPVKMVNLGTPTFNGEFGPGDTNGVPQKTTWAKFLDQPPRAKVRVSPDYPPVLKKDNITGVVMIEFEVDRKGRVVSARVLQSPHPAFEEPTIRAVLKWRFEPGVCQGRVVPFRMQVPVDFRIGDQS